MLCWQRKEKERQKKLGTAELEAEHRLLDKAIQKEAEKRDFAMKKARRTKSAQISHFRRRGDRFSLLRQSTA